jgi:lipopolysaccharide/colanic/teichoic acid biosynthesis glycosyltransferase
MVRCFDIMFSGLLLLILLPLFALIIIILKFTGEREIFYLQQRIGRNGKKFNLLKFATMLKNSPNIGTGTITIKNDKRVLPVGSFLRKSKLNELPQLLNILFGDMSLIGPRPLTPQNFASYSDDVQFIIGQVRPGLSGVGSIVFRNEEEIMHGSSATVDFYNKTIAPYKGKLEVWYVQNRSTSLYFISILATILIVLFPNSKLTWRFFKELPQPPKNLELVLGYTKI